MATKKVKFPATIYVYEIREQGKIETYLCIGDGLDDIPEDQAGEPIATYSLKRISKFVLKRDLV